MSSLTKIQIEQTHQANIIGFEKTYNITFPKTADDVKKLTEEQRMLAKTIEEVRLESLDKFETSQSLSTSQYQKSVMPKGSPSAKAQDRTSVEQTHRSNRAKFEDMYGAPFPRTSKDVVSLTEEQKITAEAIDRAYIDGKSKVANAQRSVPQQQTSVSSRVRSSSSSNKQGRQIPTNPTITDRINNLNAKIIGDDNKERLEKSLDRVKALKKNGELDLARKSLASLIKRVARFEERQSSIQARNNASQSLGQRSEQSSEQSRSRDSVAKRSKEPVRASYDPKNKEARPLATMDERTSTRSTQQHKVVPSPPAQSGASITTRSQAVENHNEQDRQDGANNSVFDEATDDFQHTLKLAGEQSGEYALMSRAEEETVGRFSPAGEGLGTQSRGVMDGREETSSTQGRGMVYTNSNKSAQGVRDASPRSMAIKVITDEDVAMKLGYDALREQQSTNSSEGEITLQRSDVIASQESELNYWAKQHKQNLGSQTLADAEGSGDDVTVQPPGGMCRT